MAAEKNFENKVKDFLRERNCWYVKYWGGVPYTRSGIPDILTCINGYFFGVELKAENGRPSPLQIVNLKKIDKTGGFGILLYPKDYDIFREIVAHLQADEYQNAWILYDKIFRKEFL